MHNKKYILLPFILIFLAGCMVTDPEPRDSKASLNKAANYNIQLGMKYAQQDMLPRAKQKLTMALQQNPDSAAAHSAMAYYQEKVKDFETAEKYYRRAISIERRTGSWLNNYGAFLCRQGRFRDAEENFNNAIADPDYINVAEAYENLGLCALQSGDKEKAKLHLQKAIAHSSARATSHLELAEILYQEGQAREAHAHWEQYEKYGPKTPQSLWLGVRITRKLGFKDLMRKNAVALKESFPQSKEYGLYKKL